MLTLEQAQAAILAEVRHCSEVETVALDDACGRFSAAELRAAIDYPPFDNSSMDGYAVCAVDLEGHDFVLPVVGESSCGSAPAPLAPGTTMRIFTGAPLPAGADTVVIQEDVRVDDGKVVFPQPVGAHQNIRRRGGDFPAGELLYGRGQRLSAYDLALLSSAGLATIPVFRRARVLIVATGDELVARGTALKPGQIYESNRVALLLQLRQSGFDVVDGGVVRDDADALHRVLRDAVEYDFIITSGGASVGDHDLVKRVFDEIGEINFWKARIKPGKPIAFGHVGKHTHFFALPGNPVSSLVGYKLFVEPALIAWHHGHTDRLMLTATAANEFRREAGRTEFLRARLHGENGKLYATALRGQESHMVGALRDTNAFIRVEVDSTGFHAGDSVLVVPLRVDWD